MHETFQLANSLIYFLHKDKIYKEQKYENFQQKNMRIGENFQQ